MYIYMCVGGGVLVCVHILSKQHLLTTQAEHTGHSFCTNHIPAKGFAAVNLLINFADPSRAPLRDVPRKNLP